MDHWADYVVFVVFLLSSLGIGLYHACSGGKQRTTQEFIVGDRKLKLLPTSISILVSYQSAIMILGLSAEMYTQGTSAWIMYILGFFIAVLVSERIFVPWMYPLKLTSVYGYFEMRYSSKSLRIFTALLGIMTAILYMGAAMYAPSLALESVTGVSALVSIPLMAFVCVAYTALGGIKAVVWTDVFQSLVIFIGLLGILIKGSIAVGGFPKALDIASSEGRVFWADFSVDPTIRHTFWGFLIGFSMNWTYVYGLNQASVQRYSSVVSLEKARMAMLLNIPALVLLMSMSCMIGIVALAYFANLQCDPLVSKQIANSNQILPLFVKIVFKDVHGFTGLFIATLFSGALSSVSSSLSASSANLWDDILLERFKDLSQSKATIVNKITVVLFGGLSAGMAFLAALMPGPISQVSIAFVGSVAGPLLGLFLVSGLKMFRWIDWKAVMAGGIVAIGVNLWLSFGSIMLKSSFPSLPPLATEGCSQGVNVTTTVARAPLSTLASFYSISYLWYVPLGALVTIIVTTVLSAIIYFTCRSEKSTVEDLEHLFIPFGDICSFKERRKKTNTDAGKSLKEALDKNKNASSSSLGRISISESTDKFTILDVSTISDGSYTQYNPPIIACETNL